MFGFLTGNVFFVTIVKLIDASFVSNDFMDKLNQIKSQPHHYDSAEQQIHDMRPIIALGCIDLSIGKEAVMSSGQKPDKFLVF